MYAGIIKQAESLREVSVQDCQVISMCNTVDMRSSKEKVTTTIYKVTKSTLLRSKGGSEQH
jgi:hypothetical protein